MQANPYFLEDLAAAVDQSVALSSCKANFIEEMESRGYLVNWDDTARTITFITPDGAHVRNRRLKGKTKYDCSVEALCSRFGEKIPLLVYGVRHFGSMGNIDLFCQKYSIIPDTHRYIYVLGLHNDCYYVGQTFHFKKRMTRHFARAVAGAAWTDANAPFHLLEVIDMENVDEHVCGEYETAKTISYMARYGISCVRGGELCHLDLVDLERHLLHLGFATRDGKPFPIDIKAKRWVDVLQRMKCFRVVFNCK